VKIAVVPEPIVTSSLLAIKKNGNTDIEYSVDLSLSTVWNEECDGELAMGCIVAKKSFVEEHTKAVNAFLREYEASIEFISEAKNIEQSAQYVVDAGVMQAVPAAKTALANLSSSIVYVDGKDMKDTLTELYRAIGIALPDDSFYYEK
jgi:NitT/TauT family transport system substrate-binding protein